MYDCSAAGARADEIDFGMRQRLEGPAASPIRHLPRRRSGRRGRRARWPSCDLVGDAELGEELGEINAALAAARWACRPRTWRRAGPAEFSGVEMSGLGAPFRTTTPTPARATARLAVGQHLACLIRSSTLALVETMKSLLAPPMRWRSARVSASSTACARSPASNQRLDVGYRRLERSDCGTRISQAARPSGSEARRERHGRPTSPSSRPLVLLL